MSAHCRELAIAQHWRQGGEPGQNSVPLQRNQATPCDPGPHVAGWGYYGAWLCRWRCPGQGVRRARACAFASVGTAQVGKACGATTSRTKTSFFVYVLCPSRVGSASGALTLPLGYASASTQDQAAFPWATVDQTRIRLYFSFAASRCERQAAHVACMP